jgi:hypothetical protein
MAGSELKIQSARLQLKLRLKLNLHRYLKANPHNSEHPPSISASALRDPSNRVSALQLIQVICSEPKRLQCCTRLKCFQCREPEPAPAPGQHRLTGQGLDRRSVWHSVRMMNPLAA